MKILIVNNAENAAKKAASIIEKAVTTKPDSVLGLATGGTMLAVYRHMVGRFNGGSHSYNKISTFNLDEYVGLPATNPCSYRFYMNENLFQHIDIDIQKTHLPDGMSKDVEAEARRYEQEIKSTSGMDIILLGLGKNGHIGFNEPSSSLASRTRIKTLSEDTRLANQQYFDSPEQMPRYAITMGIKTILDAKHCLLVATGKAKANAVRDMIEGAITANCPATALQMHERVTIIIDEDAASLLKNVQDYRHVHPNGEDTFTNA